MTAFEAPIPLNIFTDDFSKIKSLVEQSKLPQVILFNGREGIGKLAFAKKVAALHFCVNHNACGTCEECGSVQENIHPDIFIWSSEDSLKAHEIKDFMPFLSTFASPRPKSLCSKRILIVRDIEKLTVQATNKLLKTLEEPSAQALILLTCSKLGKILPTLLSRCVKWPLVNIEKAEANAKENQQKLKDLGIEEAAFFRLKSYGEAISLAQNWAQNLQPKDILNIIEPMINRFYRLLIEKEKLAHLKAQAMVMKERRRYLSQLHRQIKRENIHLNTRFVIEQLGFYTVELLRDLKL